METIPTTLEAQSATPKEVKPGRKTTEFWVTLTSVALGLLMTMGWVKPEQVDTAVPWIEMVQQIVGAVLTALASAGYAMSRGMAKR